MTTEYRSLKTIKRRVAEEVLEALGKNWRLAGHVKAGCKCQTCAVNRAIKRAFRKK